MRCSLSACSLPLFVCVSPLSFFLSCSPSPPFLMSISRVHDVSATHAASGSFSSRYLGADAPTNKYALSAHPMTAAGAVQMIKDECLLDGNPTMNLASFGEWPRALST